MFQRQTVHVMSLVNCSEYLLDNRHCGNHWIFKIIGFIHKATCIKIGKIVDAQKKTKATIVLTDFKSLFDWIGTLWDNVLHLIFKIQYHDVPEIPRSALAVCPCICWCRPPCNFPGTLRDSAQRWSPLLPQDSPQLAPWPTHMSRSHSNA